MGSLDGGENAKPGLIRNVYVRPSAETLGIDSATSGWSSAPSGAA